MADPSLVADVKGAMWRMACRFATEAVVRLMTLGWRLGWRLGWCLGLCLCLARPSIVLAVDLSTLTELDDTQLTYGFVSGRFNRSTGEQSYLLQVTNVSDATLQGPIYIELRDLSSTEVEPRGYDDQLDSGAGLYRIDGDLAPGADATKQTVFYNPSRQRFGFSVVLYHPHADDPPELPIADRSAVVVLSSSEISYELLPGAFDATTDELSYEAVLTNIRGRAIDAPIYLELRNLADPSAEARGHDHRFEDGTLLHTIDTALPPGASAAKSLRFHHPAQQPFDFELVVYAPPGDIDGDGIPDNVDPDRDGDGFDNITEEEAGTDPDDPNDFPPAIALAVDGPVERSLSATEVRLTGTVDPSFAGVINATTDRITGIEFAATRTGPDTFEVEVALAAGANVITVTASVDATSETRVVNVTSFFPPAIEILTPRGNSVIDTELLSITGRITDAATTTLPVVTVGAQQVTTTAGSEPGSYDFAVDNVLLGPGLNTLLIQVGSEFATASAELLVTLDTADAPGLPPLISISSPVLNSYLRESGFELVGTVESFTGAPSLTINEAPVTLIGSGAVASFRELYSFGGSDTLALALEATDAAGRSAQTKATYAFDGTEPAITLDADYLLPPAINAVTQNPLPFSGGVAEANLANITINGEVVVPEVVSTGQFRFEAALALSGGEPLEVTVQATDLAGNRSVLTYLLTSDTAQSIQPLLPDDGTELGSTGESVAVSVAARVVGLLSGELVVARLEPESASVPEVMLAVNGDIASGEVQVPGEAGDYRIVFEVREPSGEVLTQADRLVSLILIEDGEPEIARIEPANGATGIEANQFVSLYFDRPIEPQRLEVNLYETVHGLTYVEGDELGTDALFARGQVLEEVNRDRTLVAGKLAVLPGNRIAAFYPEQDMGYGAQVFVEVFYDGEERLRSLFDVRALPTFVTGGVFDQLQQVAAGITVELVELGRRTSTNEDGGFAFGFGDGAEDAIPGGRYALTLNPDLENPDYGTITRWITVQEGRRTKLPPFQVPLLNRELPFRFIESGEAEVVLAEGEVVLDLSDAILTFPSSRSSGSVHAQFHAVDQIPYPASSLGMPNWMYGFQPAPIGVTGTVGVDLALPRLFDSTEYVSPEAPLVLVMGVDGRSNVVVPVGVGKVESGRVKGVSSIPLSRLDFIGIALVLPEQQALLQSYTDGDIDFRQLQAALQEVQ